MHGNLLVTRELTLQNVFFSLSASLIYDTHREKKLRVWYPFWYVCMNVCIYACMYVCMYVCVYVCMYVRTYVRT